MRPNKRLGKTYYYYCKSCANEMAVVQSRTIKGVLCHMFSAQRYCSKKRNMPMPLYTKNEFSKWVMGQSNFIDLYDKWVSSNYCRWQKPSVDRIDENKTYSFDNIRLVSWLDNHNSAVNNKKMGLGNQGKRCRSIMQFTFDGKLIAEYVSGAEATRVTRIYGTCNAAMGSKFFAGGYIWIYVCDFSPELLQKKINEARRSARHRDSRTRPIVLFNEV